MKIKGKVGRSDLEGGYFTFSDGKETWKWEGGGKDLLQAGVAAEAEARAARGARVGRGGGARPREPRGALPERRGAREGAAPRRDGGLLPLPRARRRTHRAHRRGRAATDRSAAPPATARGARGAPA